VVENPLETATRSGRSTGYRCHRRVFGDGGILLNDVRKRSSAQITKVKQAPLFRRAVVVAKSRLQSFSVNLIQADVMASFVALAAGATFAG
jgi:hypothetical protein